MNFVEVMENFAKKHKDIKFKKNKNGMVTLFSPNDLIGLHCDKNLDVYCNGFDFISSHRQQPVECFNNKNEVVARFDLKSIKGEILHDNIELDFVV